jgi:hypothetical protein
MWSTFPSAFRDSFQKQKALVSSLSFLTLPFQFLT